MAFLGSAQNETEAFLEPGFSVNSLVSHLFKKGLLRGNTSQSETYFAEPTFKPSVYLEYLATDKFPDTPPSDFVALTDVEIQNQFGILAEELEDLKTSTSDGGVVFSIERSVEYPHIYRVNNLRMRPAASSPANSFNAITGKSRVNMLATTIPFTYGNSSYKGRFLRTAGNGALSMEGRDFILPQQLAYIYDYDLGFFVAHDADSVDFSRNTVTNLRPPAISCYLYKGKFGNLGWLVKDDAIVLDGQRLLIGTSTPSDPSLSLDVSGAAFLDTILTTALATKSDIRLKENIAVAPINKEILGLAPRFYNYIAKPSVLEYGLIAQEVETVAPELVRTAGEYKSVLYDRLGVHLLPIIKAQEERIDVLESEMAEMKKAMAILIRNSI
jgi:hypothetical protein